MLVLWAECIDAHSKRESHKDKVYSAIKVRLWSIVLATQSCQIILPNTKKPSWTIQQQKDKLCNIWLTEHFYACCKIARLLLSCPTAIKLQGVWIVCAVFRKVAHAMSFTKELFGVGSSTERLSHRYEDKEIKRMSCKPSLSQCIVWNT